MKLRMGLAAALMHLVTAFVHADDWPTYRRDYSRSGSTAETIDAEHLKQAWLYTDQAPRPAWPAPARWDAFGKVPDLRSMRNYDPVYHVTAVGESCFYASSADDSVTCLDLVTGQPRWSFTAQGPVRIAPTWWEGNLYFGSDDGHAYCVAADTGKLVWKFSPKPNERLVINDGRLISFWPVRTGVVVADGTAYFGAALLPWKKSYLCAVDAKTGQPQGPERFVKELDGATLEGGLVISAKRLIAPQGRIAPLVFDRADGKPLGSLTGASGGCFLLVTDDNQVVVGAGRGKGQVTANDITVVAPKVKTKVVSFNRGNAVVVRGDKIWVLDDHLVTATNRKTMAKLWQQSIPHACELLLSGDALFVGGRDEVLAFEPDTGKQIWRQTVKGRAYGLALANGKLLASTDEGSIHCFTSSTVKPMPNAADAPRKLTPTEKSTQPEFVVLEGPTHRFTAPDEVLIRWKTAQPTPSIVEFGEGDDLQLRKSDELKTTHEIKVDGLRKGRLYQYRIKAEVDKAVKSTAFAECDMHANYVEPPRRDIYGQLKKDDPTWDRLLKATRGVQGFCLIVAPKSEALAHRLVLQTPLHVVVVHTDPAAVTKARSLYRSDKSYGPSLSVLQVNKLDELPLPPGFANVVICEGDAKSHAESLFRYVRPEGGILLVDPLNAAELTPKTRGRLPGAADWTHQYGKADNSGFAGEQLADASKADDLEVLWFGQPGPRFNIDRNPRKPSPLASKGRLFVQGHRRVGALDSFNGTFLWTLELPRFARYNMPHDCSNWCCDDDNLYLAIDDQCWTLKATDGAVDKVRRLADILTPEQAKDSDWGYLSKVGDTILGSSIKRGSQFLGYWGGENWYDGKAGQRYICSNHLFALPADKNQPRWTWSSGSILNSTITVSDGRVTFVESRSPEIKSPSGQLGNEIWKDLWMVSLDLATGKPAWSRPLKTIPGGAAFHLIQGEGKTVVSAADKGKFEVHVFDAKSGEPVWTKDYPWEADHHGKHLSHPAVVGGHLILRPHVIDLATGSPQLKGFPPGHGCGAYCATKNLLIFRGNEVVLWDVDHNASSRLPRLRPDCWISTIPANGMLLSPEGGGGCSCGQWLEMSVGFLPKAVK